MTNFGPRHDIVTDIAAVAEQAYRRGFQHGHEAATRGARLAFDVHRWRFVMDPAMSPEMLGGRIVRAVDRLAMESTSIVASVRAELRRARAGA